MREHNKEFEVDGIVYSTTHFPVSEAIPLATDVAKLVMEPLAEALKAIPESEFDKKSTQDILKTKIKPAMIAGVLPALTRNMDGHANLKLIKGLCKGLQIQEEGSFRPIQFDLDFAGSILHLFKVVKEVIAFQFLNFSDAPLTTMKDTLVTKGQITKK